MEKNDLEDIALRLQSIINTAIDGIITIDNRGTVETINQAAAKQFEYDPQEIIGHNVKKLMPDPYHSEHDGYLKRYEKTKEPRIIGIGREVVGKKKSGELFPFRLAVSEVILNDRTIFTGIIHDLTKVNFAEKKLLKLNEQLEEEIEKRTEELEVTVNKLLSTNDVLKKREIELNEALNKEKELNELKSRFVSMASHEFRTPLSTILSSANLISKYTEESQNDKREKHINRIKSAVNNLTGILNDFLSLSKIEEGKEQIVLEKINIHELCKLVLDEIKGLIHKNQKIEVQHILEEDELFIISDRRILKNVLFNIISNAIKYSKEDGNIKCHLEKNDDMWSFQIIDDGIGIPKNEQKHLFDRFFRASNVENIQGTGLGLNIVKRYIELLGGTIGFKSEENKGTTFKIQLPNLSL